MNSDQVTNYIEEDYLNVPWEEAYRRLIEEAPYITGDEYDASESVCEIPWAKPELIVKGQKFARENIVGLAIAHSGALLLGFSLKCLSRVLLATGGFNGVTKSLDRIIDTNVHLMPWYNSDLIGPDGKGLETIKVVQKMHRLAFKRCLEMNKNCKGDGYDPNQDEELQRILDKSPEERLEYLNAIKADLDYFDTSECPLHLNTYNPKVVMSQFDYALAQFAFFAPPYLAPEAMGINDPEGLEAFAHLWAVIGRLLGVRDRYNLALNPKKQVLVKVHDQIAIGALKHADLTTAGLQFSYGTAMGILSKGFSLPALTYFLLVSSPSLQPFKGQNLSKLMTFGDKLFVWLMQLFFFLVYHLDFLKRICNRRFHKKVSMTRQERTLVQVSGIYKGK